MLITFLNMDTYEAVGIALASDVLASAVSVYTYGKNRNLDHEERAYYDGQHTALYYCEDFLYFTIISGLPWNSRNPICQQRIYSLVNKVIFHTLSVVVFSILCDFRY